MGFLLHMRWLVAQTTTHRGIMGFLLHREHARRIHCSKEDFTPYSSDENFEELVCGWFFIIFHRFLIDFA
jgi:hypothetical protein